MVASVTDGGGDNGPIGPADSDATPEDERPQICISGRHLRELTADTVDVLTQANTPPVVFQRAGRLVRMRVHEDGRPVLEDHSENTVRERAAKVADWLKLVKSKETWRDVPSGPPLDVIRNLMAAPAWPFPAVTSITQAPALRPDGSILSQSGYDAVTRLIYAPAAGLRMPTIPEHPSHDDRRAAREVLEDILADFPFDSDASRAHAFALMLTAITRPAIEGFTPMAVITAPEAGTGKGLLADLVAIIATGSTQQNTPAPDNEGEWRDSIFSALRDGPVFVMLDNLRGALSSTALESALTSEVVKQRVKGVSTDEAIPQRAVWVATGNNLQLAGDMPRRCYRIRLDAEQAHPERRKDFRHEHLRAYARLHRGELLAALLTLARAWFADGCPAYDIPKKGSFEEWARIVGSILAHADIAGFLTDEDAMYAEADPSRSQWAAFLLAWHAAYGDTPQAIATIARDIAGEGNAVKLDYQALRDAVPDALAGELASVGKFTRRLGYALRPQVSRRYETPDGDVIWLMRGGEDSRLRAILWQVHFKPGSRSSGSEAAESENHHSHPSGLNDSSLVDTLRVMASDDSLDRMEKNRDGESRIERDVINTRGASDNHSQSLASLANHTGGDFPIEHVVIEEAVREAPGDTPSGASGKGATE